MKLYGDSLDSFDEKYTLEKLLCKELFLVVYIRNNVVI